MCGRYTLTKKQQEVVDRFNAEIEGVIKDLFNSAPTQELPVISDENPAKIAFYKWGLIPSWSKDSAIGSKMINARAEGLHEKPSFSKLLERQRCIIPADGFYEWKQTAQGKQPYRITLKNNDLFAFAGLWDKWRNPAGLLVYTFTIITTEPNELMKSIHNRMPAILEKGAEKEWLNPKLPFKDTETFLKPYVSDEMRAYPVSKAVNSVQNNSPDLIKEVPLETNLKLF
jgi:putative SOS response-associated peptidase YedK